VLHLIDKMGGAVRTLFWTEGERVSWVWEKQSGLAEFYHITKCRKHKVYHDIIALFGLYQSYHKLTLNEIVQIHRLWKGFDRPKSDFVCWCFRQLHELH